MMEIEYRRREDGTSEVPSSLFEIHFSITAGRAENAVDFFSFY